MSATKWIMCLAVVALQGCAFLPHDKSLVNGQQHAQPERDGDAWVFANGRFIGEVQNGQPTGPGVFVTPDGTRVEASFANGIAERGKVTDRDGALIHDGAFVNGLWPEPARLAFGTYQFSGLVYGRSHAEGELTDAVGKKLAFSGPLLDGKPHGIATLTDSRGNRQQLPYAAGVRQGQGKFLPVDGVAVVQYWQADALVHSHPEVAVLGAANAPRCKTDLGDWYLAAGRCSGPVGRGEMTVHRPDGQVRFAGRELQDGVLEGELYDHVARQRMEGTFRAGRVEGLVRVAVNEQVIYQGPAREGRYEGTGLCRHAGQMEPCQHQAGVRNDPTHQYRLALAEQQREIVLVRQREQEARRALERAEEEAEEREERRRRQAEEEEGARIIGQAILGVGQQVGQAYADMAEGEARVRADNAERQAEYDRIQEAERAAARDQRNAQNREQLAQSQLQQQGQLAEMQRRQRDWEARAAAEVEASQRAYNQAQQARSQARQSSQLLASSSSTIETAGAPAATAKAATIVWPEGIAVCKPARAGGRPDDLHCSGPISTGVIESLSARVRVACGSAADRGDGIREYSSSGELRVFGCGFGINPEKANNNTWHADQAARAGLGSVSGRRSYRCPASQSDPCFTP